MKKTWTYILYTSIEKNLKRELKFDKRKRLRGLISKNIKTNNEIKIQRVQH